MILPVKDIRESELFTMQDEPVTSLELMERAGSRFTEHLLKSLDLSIFESIVVFCGPGNNGGDGLVIARLLAQEGYPVETVICSGNSQVTQENKENLDRLNRLKISNLKIYPFDAWNGFAPENNLLIIDALFGIGISRILEGEFSEIINRINQSEAVTIAVDVPSGLFPDQHTPQNAPCVRASYTYTFQFQKLAYLLPENAFRVGKTAVIDIGLKIPPDFRGGFPIIDKSLVNRLIKPPGQFDHKGTNGHGLLIAGSAGMPGAAVLAAKSALRGGIGKVTVHTPEKVGTLVTAAVPEALLNIDPDPDSFSKIDLEMLPAVNTIAIGPGIGKRQVTVSAFGNLLDEIHSPIIIDADALNILSENKTWLGFIPDRSILTPHLKEFERLAGKPENDFDRLDKLVRFAQKYNLVVILKGANTAIAMPDGKLFFNSTGNPGMATAGSGDVLTGLLLALLSKGYTPETTALTGVYLHGLAADIAVSDKESFESLIASDISNYFGEAYKWIRTP